LKKGRGGEKQKMKRKGSRNMRKEGVLSPEI
jgi:hypothetical protein